MTFVNMVVPWALSFVDALEQWDFASEALTAELWKNFYTSLLNIIFFVGVNGTIMFTDDTEEIEGEAECKEDKLVDEFLKLIISEIIIRYVLSYLIEFPWKFFESLCAGDDFEWKDDFALGDEVVWLFTVELEFWMC